jgi:hypothetical protein
LRSGRVADARCGVSRQERKGRKELQGEEEGSGSDVCRSSWRALRDAVNPTPRSDSHAKSAKVAEDGRIPVASHLVCDGWRTWNNVEPERRRQAPTLHPCPLGDLGALGVMNVPTLTAEDAERAEGCKAENTRTPVANALGSAERAHRLCVRRLRVEKRGESQQRERPRRLPFLLPPSSPGPANSGSLGPLLPVGVSTCGYLNA